MWEWDGQKIKIFFEVRRAMDSFFGVRARNVKEFYRIVGFLKPIVYKEKVGYDLLQDILNLCRVYY